MKKRMAASRTVLVSVVAVCSLWCSSAAAHSFGRLYTLPVPFDLYAWAAAATLIVSFILITSLAARQQPLARASTCDVSGTVLERIVRRMLPLLKILSVMCLMLGIATALFGSRDPYRNFSMVGFWVVFMLGGSYLTAIFGNAFALLNPWQIVGQWIGRIIPRYWQGLIRYPARLQSWPALLLLLAFVAWELLGTDRPATFGKILLTYSLFNWVGIGLFGGRAWFRHVEFLAVFFAMLGRMGRFASVGDPRQRTVLRTDFSGLWHSSPASLVTVLFILAMLATTAFDGISATQLWVKFFWGNPWGWVSSITGFAPMSDIRRGLNWYFGWQLFWLVALPFIYFGLYALTLRFGNWLAGSKRGLGQTVLDFSYSLLPIALVYHMAHYATLLLNDGLKIISLLSDPFGWGWNLFGTAWKFRAPILPEMSWVWHGQVGLILLGHVISVYVAHRIALRVYESHRAAVLSQLPMLAFMVGLTIFGLWILVQPLTTERMM